MPSKEWRQYKELLSQEKEIIRFLDTDMPTEPYLLDRMQESAIQLKMIVETIDKYGTALDEAILKAS